MKPEQTTDAAVIPADKTQGGEADKEKASVTEGATTTEPPTAEAADAKTATAAANHKTQPVRRWWPAVLVLMIAGLAVWLSPQWLPLLSPQRAEQVLSPSPQRHTVKAPEAAPAPSEEAPEAPAATVVDTATKQQEATTAIEPVREQAATTVAATADKPSPSAASAVVGTAPDDQYAEQLQLAKASRLALQEQLDSLQAQLTATKAQLRQSQQQRQTMEQQQHQLWQSQQARQLARLDSRDLAVMAAAWEELAANPLLSEAQRAKAAAQAQAAFTLEQQRQQWLHRLASIVQSLHVPPRANLVPQTYWWQRWLARQVNIHHSMSHDEQQKQLLQQRLRDIMLTLQQTTWPEDAQWHPVWQQLQQRMLHENLPESFAQAHQQMQQLKTIARTWQEARL